MHFLLLEVFLSSTYQHLAGTPGACGAALSLAVALIAIASPIVNSWWNDTLQQAAGTHGQHESKGQTCYRGFGSFIM